MRLLRISPVLAVAVLWSAPSSAQLARPCLHGSNETPTQAERREEATDAADLINRVLGRKPLGSSYPSWEQLENWAGLSSYRGMRGPLGDLARKMTWGANQPLPGWQIHYVAENDAYAFSLTDVRDPCRLTLASNDRGIVIEGQPTMPRTPRVVPLDSSQ